MAFYGLVVHAVGQRPCDTGHSGPDQMIGHRALGDRQAFGNLTVGQFVFLFQSQDISDLAHRQPPVRHTLPPRYGQKEEAYPFVYGLQAQQDPMAFKGGRFKVKYAKGRFTQTPSVLRPNSTEPQPDPPGSRFGYFSHLGCNIRTIGILLPCGWSGWDRPAITGKTIAGIMGDMTILQPPVIVVPGIQATSLLDYYNIPPEEVWRYPFQSSIFSLLPKHDHERLAMHPSDTRYEAVEPARVLFGSVHDYVYSEQVEELRHDLTEQGSHPVFPFPYDWRQDCRLLADRLNLFADEVIKRVGLMKGDYTGYNGPVDIVCHSMGGLVAADCVNRFGASGKFRKVVSFGTPFHGSVEAVWKLTVGLWSFTSGSSRERISSRTIPSVYQLLPTYKGAVDADEPELQELLEVDAWQPQMIDSLASFINTTSASIDAVSLLKNFLQTAKSLKESANSPDVLTNLQNADGGWLAVAGIGEKTFVDIGSNIGADGKIRFTRNEKVELWEGHGSDKTGDGTVPFPGAVPGFLPREEMICVTKRDFKYGELESFMGLHSMLPKMDFAQKLAIKYLKNMRYYLPEGGEPAPGVEKDSWKKPIEFDS